MQPLSETPTPEIQEIKHGETTITQVRRYQAAPGSNSKPDVVIINSHGGTDLRILPNHGQLRAFFGEERLDQYINLETDHGINELTTATAVELISLGFNVTIIDVLYPRAILDVNRSLGEGEDATNPAIREVLPNEYLETNREALEAIHNATVEAVRNVLNSLAPGSFVIDPHSMWGQQGKQSQAALGPSKDELEAYMAEKIDPGKIDFWRILALISSFELDDDAIVHGSEPLYAAMIEELDAAGIPWRKNFPYHLLRTVMSVVWSQICKAKNLHYFVADIPAWMLSEEIDLNAIRSMNSDQLQTHLDDKLRNKLSEININFTISEENLKILATIIAQAIRKVSDTQV